MKFNSIRTFLTIIAIAALACMAANAGTITYSFALGNCAGCNLVPTPTDFHTAALAFPGTLESPLALPLWNPALFAGQTLTSVVINLTATVDVGTVTLTTNSAASQTFSDVVSSSIFAQGPSGALSPDPITMPAPFTTGGFITLGGNTGTVITCPAATPSSACNSVSYTPGPVNGVSSSSPAVGSYIGIGTFALDFASAGSSTITGGTNFTTSITELGSLVSSVTYNYAPQSGTPEPATMAMLGSALIGLGLIGRKRFVR